METQAPDTRAPGQRPLLPPGGVSPAESRADRGAAVPSVALSLPAGVQQAHPPAELGDLPGVGLAVGGAGSPGEHVDSGPTGPGKLLVGVPNVWGCWMSLPAALTSGNGLHAAGLW